MQSLIKSLQNSISNFISCSILDLKQTIETCYNLIDQFELQNQRTSKLNLGNYIFTLNLTDKDPLPGSKKEISLNLGSFIVSNPLNPSKLSDLSSPSKFADFSEILMKDMLSSYQETMNYTSSTKVPKQVQYKHFSFMADLENFNLRKGSLETFNMKKEIEWDRQELKFMKGQVKTKLHELKTREKEIKEESNRIRTERVKLAKESQRLEKEVEEVDEKRARYFKLQETLKDIMNSRPRVSEVNLNSSFMSNSSFTSVDPGESLDEEQKLLEKELEDLKQALSQSCPENQDSITMKITKIQTRLTSIRSERLLTSNHKRSIKMTSTISKLQKSMSIKQAPLPRMPLSTSYKSIVPMTALPPSLASGRRTTITPIPFQLSSHHVRSPTYTPPVPLTPTSSNRSNNATPINERVELHSHKKSEGYFTSEFRGSLETEEKDENQEQKLKSLVLKEARLLMKEEEILKKENIIKANLDKRISDKDILDVVRNERMAMNRKSKECDARERKVEEMFAEAERFEGKVKSRSREVERAQSDLDAERGRFEQEKEEFYQKIEEIKRLVVENI
jgi:hypothetical protein